MDINSIVITGKILSDNYSHTAHNYDFRKIELESERRSKINDFVKIIYRYEGINYSPGTHIRVIGTIRSRREGSKLVLYVFAEEIEPFVGEDENELIIQGFVCSEPYYKEVSGRKLTQMLVCVENKRKCYVSVLIWKKTKLKPGDRIIICGRLQSREYMNKKTIKCINEISAYRVECRQS